MNEFTDVFTGEWTAELGMSGWKNGMEAWFVGRTYRFENGWTEEWIDGQMNGWLDK